MAAVSAMPGKPRPLFFINLAHGYDHFFMLIFPTAVLALEREWGGGYGELLSLGTATFVVFGLATLPAGWLGDRWSRPGMMVVFFFGTGAASILVGLTSGAVALAAGLGLIGLFAAIYHPVATALIVQNAGQPGRALGVNGVFGNFGVALAPVITGALITLGGWRTAFIVPGVLCVLTGFAFLRAGAGLLDAGRAESGAKAGEIRRGVQIRVFAVVAVAALFGGLVFNGITVALPKVFEERLAGLVSTLAEVGLAASLVFCLASFAQIWIGRLLDRVGARPVLIAMAGLQIPCLVLASQLWGPAMIAVAIPLMLLVFGEIPIAAWLVGKYAAGHWRSRIYAVQYVLSLGVSAAVVPLIAILHEHTGGFAILFLLMAAAAAVICIAALALPDTRPRADVAGTEGAVRSRAGAD
jgi:MFS family permease